MQIAFFDVGGCHILWVCLVNEMWPQARERVCNKWGLMKVAIMFGYRIFFLVNFEIKFNSDIRNLKEYYLQNYVILSLFIKRPHLFKCAPQVNPFYQLRSINFHQFVVWCSSMDFDGFQLCHAKLVFILGGGQDRTVIIFHYKQSCQYFIRATL